jgi:hypothetical protein
MNERQRAILQQVAEGKLRPEEAAVLLDQADDAEQDQGSERGEPSEEPAAGPGGRPTGATAGPATADSGIRRVRVVGNFRAARVVADPTIREAIAEGPHVARREGDLLIVESALDETDMPGFVFNRGMRNWRLNIPSDFAGRPGRPPRPPRPPRSPRAGWSWGEEEAASWNRTSWSHDELTVRMRPDLPLEVELSAGTLRVDGLTGPLRLDIRAGSARIEHVRGPIEALVAAGSLRVEALLTQGASRIRCDASSVRLNLERGSNVLVRARPELSKLTLPGHGVVGSLGLGERQEVKIGDGTATLDIDATMSKISVTADQ